MKIRHIPFLFICLTACTSQNNDLKNQVACKNSRVIFNDETQNTPDYDMSNPVFIIGTDIGSLFKAYYKVGQFEKMVQFTDSSTIHKFGRDSLMKMYRKLNLGYDIKLKSLTPEGNEKILHYESQTFATKGIRRLHVVIENDTPRIVPQHLERGEIFE